MRNKRFIGVVPAFFVLVWASCGGQSGIPEGEYRLDRGLVKEELQTVQKKGDTEQRQAATKLIPLVQDMDATLNFDRSGTVEYWLKSGPQEHTLKGTWQKIGSRFELVFEGGSEVQFCDLEAKSIRCGDDELAMVFHR